MKHLIVPISVTLLSLLYWTTGSLSIIHALVFKYSGGIIGGDDYFDDHFVLPLFLITLLVMTLSFFVIRRSQNVRIKKIYKILILLTFLIPLFFFFSLNPFCNEVVNCGSMF